MRLANPAIVVKYKLATDLHSIGNELEAYTRARLGLEPSAVGLPVNPKLVPPPAQPQLAGAAGPAVAAIKKLAAGAALLMEWDESGMPPVSPEVSESRAAVCATCPQNAKGKSLSEFFTVPLANLTKRKFEKLEQMKLTTPHDQFLTVCQACLCPLRLKVHTPIELILKRLKPDVKAELDPRCWILKS